MNFETRISGLEKEIEIINNRNKSVESDKAWETSAFRVSLLALITYIMTSIIFYFIGVESFYVTAIIPTVGYLLSVQTLPIIKKWWINNCYNK